LADAFFFATTSSWVLVGKCEGIETLGMKNPASKPQQVVALGFNKVSGVAGFYKKYRSYQSNAQQRAKSKERTKNTLQQTPILCEYHHEQWETASCLLASSA